MFSIIIRNAFNNITYTIAISTQRQIESGSPKLSQVDPLFGSLTYPKMMHCH